MPSTFFQSLNNEKIIAKPEDFQFLLKETYQPELKKLRALRTLKVYQQGLIAKNIDEFKTFIQKYNKIADITSDLKNLDNETKQDILSFLVEQSNIQKLTLKNYSYRDSIDSIKTVLANINLQYLNIDDSVIYENNMLTLNIKIPDITPPMVFQQLTNIGNNYEVKVIYERFNFERDNENIYTLKINYNIINTQEIIDIITTLRYPTKIIFNNSIDIDIDNENNIEILYAAIANCAHLYQLDLGANQPPQHIQQELIKAAEFNSNNSNIFYGANFALCADFDALRVGSSSPKSASDEEYRSESPDSNTSNSDDESNYKPCYKR